MAKKVNLHQNYTIVKIVKNGHVENKRQAQNCFKQGQAEQLAKNIILLIIFIFNQS